MTRSPTVLLSFALWAAGLALAPVLPLGGALGGVAEAAPANPFRVEGSATRLAPGAKGTVQVRLIVPPGHHVYADMIQVEITDAAGLKPGAASLPPGLLKPDPANPAQPREVFDLDVIIDIPVQAPAAAGPQVLGLRVGYQGCKGGLCYMPNSEDLQIRVDVAAPKTDGGARYGPFGGDSQWVSAGSAGPAAQASGGAAAPAPAQGPHPDLLPALPASADVRPPGMEDRQHPVRARLLVDQDGLRAGDRFRLGVHLSQDEGWHTYWRSPGDIGLPTEIQWTVPDGATHTELQFPVPHRYDVQGIISYGYDEQVLFFTDVTLPPELAPGAHSLQASVSWLVCEVMCIPGSAELSLPVEILASDAAAPQPSAAAPFFDHFASQHPSSPVSLKGVGLESAISATAVRPEEPFQVAFLVSPTEGGKLSWATREGQGSWPAFTPITSNNWMLTGAKVEPAPGGGMLVLLSGETFSADPLPEKDRVGGLFQFEVDGRPVVTELSLDLPWAAPGAAVTASTSPLFALAQGEAVALAGPPGAPPPPATDERSFLGMLLLAFVGGGILNIMPCVLPVLTLKLYSLVAQQDSGASHRKSAGVAYSAGIVASFLVLAGLVVALKFSFGSSVGWGFQFQYPGYVAALATLVFAFGLSLFGVFELPALGANQAAQASSREGMAGYFLTGVFTTLLATPCSAPFLGTGMGFAFSLPAWGIALFFAAAGLGLASPFLVIAFLPGLMRFLPRPGAWMETFKQLMGFTLMATTVWLVDVLGAQVGRDGVTGFLVFLTAVGLGGWFFGRFGGPTQPRSRQAATFVGAVILSVAVGWRFLKLDFAEAEAAASGPVDVADLSFDEHIPWQPFSNDQLAALDGHTVFVDFTADWCLTCKVNEKTVLSTDTVRQAMASRGVVPLKADWTRKDAEITTWLERYGRAGVPFYLVVPADRSRAPIPLGEVITPQSVVEALDAASS